MVSHFTKLAKSERRAAEAVRFGIVGLVASAIQYGAYIVCVDVAGVKPVPATVASYLVSFVCNYFLSSYFTFKAAPTARNGAGFILSHLVNLGLQTALVAIFKNFVSASWALLPAMAICVPVNFLLVRFCFKSKFFNRKK